MNNDVFKFHNKCRLHHVWPLFRVQCGCALLAGAQIPVMSAE